MAYAESKDPQNLATILTKQQKTAVGVVGGIYLVVALCSLFGCVDLYSDDSQLLTFFQFYWFYHPQCPPCQDLLLHVIFAFGFGDSILCVWNYQPLDEG